MANAARVDRERVVVDLPLSIIADLDWLQEHTGSAYRTYTVGQAIKIARRVLEVQDDGGALEHSDGKREVFT